MLDTESIIITDLLVN